MTVKEFRFSLSEFRHMYTEDGDINTGKWINELMQHNGMNFTDLTRVRSTLTEVIITQYQLNWFEKLIDGMVEQWIAKHPYLIAPKTSDIGNS